LSIPDIAKLLVQLAGGAEVRQPPARKEVRVLQNERQAMGALDEREWNDGTHTDFSCPDCGGVLREVGGGRGNPRHCSRRIGHAMSAETLDAQQVAVVEVALSAGMRLLGERAELTRRIAARPGTPAAVRASFEERARVAEQHRDTIRGLLARLEDAGSVD